PWAAGKSGDPRPPRSLAWVTEGRTRSAVNRTPGRGRRPRGGEARGPRARAGPAQVYRSPSPGARKSFGEGGRRKGVRPPGGSSRKLLEENYPRNSMNNVPPRWGGGGPCGTEELCDGQDARFCCRHLRLRPDERRVPLLGAAWREGAPATGDE